MVLDESITEEEAIRDPALSDVRESTESMVRYLCTMGLVMAVLYFVPFFLARSPYYDRINPSYFAQPLNYSFATAGQNADVVLFGDSTALFGIDPSQMSSALGVKVLNLPNTQGSLLVNDDLTLRRYLATNRAPKVIVFYFAPWDFDYGHADFDLRPTYEGQEVLLRQGTSSELRAFALKHRMSAVAFPLRFYATVLQLVLHPDPHPGQAEQLAATYGHIISRDQTVLQAPCSFPPLLLDNIRFDWVSALGRKYTSPETKVLIYAAPVPTCANVSSVVSQPYSKLPAAPPRQVPPDFFSDDIRYIHALPRAVPPLTQNLTEAVRPLLGSGNPVPRPAAPAHP